MPQLTYSVDLTAPPVDLATQALAVVRLQEFAQRNGLALQEREESYQRHFVLQIPADRLNDVLWELDLAGLLRPNQRIAGPSALHTKLEERFSWLEWVDEAEESV